jgi:hypothetical protein
MRPLTYHAVGSAGLLLVLHSEVIAHASQQFGLLGLLDLSCCVQLRARNSLVAQKLCSEPALAVQSYEIKTKCRQH